MRLRGSASEGHQEHQGEHSGTLSCFRAVKGLSVLLGCSLGSFPPQPEYSVGRFGLVDPSTAAVLGRIGALAATKCSYRCCVILQHGWSLLMPILEKKEKEEDTVSRGGPYASVGIVGGAPGLTWDVAETMPGRRRGVISTA